MDGTTPQSQLIFGDLHPEHPNLSTQPKNTLTVAKTAHAGQAHFTMLLAPNGIIGTDEKAIDTTSNAKNFSDFNAKQLRVSIESAFPVSPMPE